MPGNPRQRLAGGAWPQGDSPAGHTGKAGQASTPSRGLPPSRRGRRATGLIQEVSISQRPSGVVGPQRVLSPPDPGHSISSDRPQAEKVLRTESSLKPVIPLQSWVVALPETTLNPWGCARGLPGTDLAGTLLSGEGEHAVPQGV